MIRYTGPNLFAVSASLPTFLRQGDLPVMGFVLACTPGILFNLAVTEDMHFGLSVTNELDLTQRL